MPTSSSTFLPTSSEQGMFAFAYGNTSCSMCSGKEATKLDTARA